MRAVCSSMDAVALFREAIPSVDLCPGENGLALFLDDSNALLGFRCFPGDVHRVKISMVSVEARASELSASKVIFLHSHQYQSPTPSTEDLVAMRSIQDSCLARGISFVDFIVVSEHDFFSARGRKLLA